MFEVIMDVGIGPPRPDVMLSQFATQQGWNADAFQSRGHLFNRYRFTVEKALLSPALPEFERIMRQYYNNGHIFYVEWNELLEKC